MGIRKFFTVFLIILSAGFIGLISFRKQDENLLSSFSNQANDVNEGGLGQADPRPLSIEYLRSLEYPGSDFVIEQELENGVNYKRYIVSYKSEGLKIYALLTVPLAEIPEGGWPTIIFNHGYIPPTEYKTTERYIAYTDAFSRNGYILLRPDYRGHGNSEGAATGGYGSSGYTIDVLNALSSLKKYPGVNTDKIGMWGHSMGGFVTLRNMVVSKDIKAGVIWAGVVGSYQDLFERWRRPNAPISSPSTRGGSWRQTLSAQFGDPSKNPDFWASLSANTFLSDISGPLQVHHGTADTSVPVEFSTILQRQMEGVGKESETFIYQGDDHNLTNNLGVALDRSVKFLDKYLK